jgi:cytidine deaminase
VIVLAKHAGQAGAAGEAGWVSETGEAGSTRCEIKAGDISDDQLVALASQAREKAYVPYSHFRVGAALIDEKGRLFTGCNIENASFGATNCAERTAIFKAISEGSSGISRMAVVCDQDEPCMPCGICRQVLSEFATPDFVLLAGRQKGGCEAFKLNELLPRAFKLK